MAIAIAMRITIGLSMLFLGATQSCSEETESSILLQPTGPKLHKTVKTHMNKEAKEAKEAKGAKETRETQQHSVDAALLNTGVHEEKAHNNKETTESKENQAAFDTYLRVQGHFSSASTADLEAERMVPLMTREEIQFFRQELSKADAYLEFGVGGSSAVASTYPNLQCYKGIDSSKDWIEQVSKEDTIAKLIERGIAELKYVDIGKTGRLGYPVDNTTFTLWPKYSNEGFAQCHTQAKHRLVLVDGRFRVACFSKLLLAMDQEGASKTHILIHNYRWPEYHVIEEFADLIEMRGGLALFQKKSNADPTSLKQMGLNFEHEPL